ncbi:MAG TPA: hypothetical protein VGN83_16960 [Falsiroseomonas sp.]|jgi:hypothetical protein|nr:hypothetical protein [Falsiroseomonas sp.]
MTHHSLAILSLAVLLASAVVGDPAQAQPAPAHGHHGHAGMPHRAAAVPTLPGQDAFGAVQEIVGILEADPTTDWSKVNLAALREHLIDMNEVTLNATAAEQPVANGVAVTVTGSGRTLEAIRRMIPAHARELDRFPGWTTRTEAVAEGVRLVVTSTNVADVARLRGLGFIGLMVSGSHHQPHHLAMARGEHMH